jgi:hypothetical protein
LASVYFEKTASNVLYFVLSFEAIADEDDEPVTGADDAELTVEQFDQETEPDLADDDDEAGLLDLHTSNIVFVSVLFLKSHIWS